MCVCVCVCGGGVLLFSPSGKEYIGGRMALILGKSCATQVQEALAFAEEELVPLGEDRPELMEDLEEVMALFAFPDKQA